MQAAHNTSSITSSVNERRFLAHLRDMFTAKTTVLAEVMQNARRAGATAVHLDFNDGNLTVTDNGCGVANFRDLITVAESGWSEDVQASEQPFGIGFFSVSFSADTVRVESRGKQITFASTDLIEKKPIPIETSEFIGGTRITLIGCKLSEASIAEAVRAFAKGFSIPVYWQGEALPQPHALANLKLIDTAVGQICIGGLSNIEDPCFNSKGVVYCQGLPIGVSKFSESFGVSDSSVIVHIDFQRFKPRMPDRACLIDEEDAYQAIIQSIKQVWYKEILAQKAVLGFQTFADRFWDIARRAGCLSVMNEVPYIPAQAIDSVEEYPEVSTDWSSCWTNPARGISQDDVSSGKVTICQDFTEDDCPNGDGFIRLTAAMTRGWQFISHLPPGHWANEHLKDLLSMELRIGGKVLAEESFSGAWTSARVKLFEELSVCLDGEWIKLDDAVAMRNEEWSGDGVVFVPKSDKSPGYVLKQLSNYVNEHNEYQETDADLDHDKFDSLVAIMAGEQASTTVEKCLLSASTTVKRNLYNKVFLVRFDDKGNPTVTEQ